MEIYIKKALPKAILEKKDGFINTGARDKKQLIFKLLS